MTGCKKIERLIHLHREGERTPAEDREVRGHVARCRACAETLRSVGRAGEAIAVARIHIDQAAPAPDLVAITGAGAPPAAVPGHGGLGLRPAIVFALLCALVLAAQRGRDALQSAGMERRLAGLSAGSGADQAGFAAGMAHIADLIARHPDGGNGAASARASAVPRFLIPAGAGDDLFREYAGKYPSLAGINPYDGIDDRERAVLSTEGKAFLEEFRSLMRKGE
jgi:anti-sigma factor RsiW